MSVDITNEIPYGSFYSTSAENKARESKCSKRKGRREVLQFGDTSLYSMLPKQSAEFLLHDSHQKSMKFCSSSVTHTALEIDTYTLELSKHPFLKYHQDTEKELFIHSRPLLQ